MKRIVFISMLAMLIPMIGMSQNQSTFIDDVYFKPSDAKLAPAKTNVKQKSATKNGAREIVFIELKRPDSLLIDSVTLLGQATDSLDSEGNYINEFNGSQSDLEYAERIRRFHDPKYTVFISDPAYNDIYFLNSSDWNVYVDGPYAYVTPTWTNPNYWNYRYNTWGYGNWGFGYGYGWNSPWGYNGYYGYGCGWGYGYGCGWGSGYNCFDNYYGYDNGYWGGGSWGGVSYQKPDSRHNEGNRRQYGDSGRGSASSRLGSTSGTATGTRASVISAGYSGRSSGSAYTVVRDGNSTRGSIQSDAYSRGGGRSAAVNNTARSYQYDTREAVGRNTGTRTSTYDYRSGSDANSTRTGYAATTNRTSGGSVIDTRPRTATAYNGTNNGYSTSTRGSMSTTPSSTGRTGYTSGSGAAYSSGRNTTYSVGSSPRGNYSSSSPSNGSYSSPRSTYSNSSSSSTPNYNSSRSSNESYRSSTPSTSSSSTSSSSSSGSYSGGSSSSGGGSRSGGGSSDSGGSRSGGSSGGGRR